MSLKTIVKWAVGCHAMQLANVLKECIASLFRVARDRLAGGRGLTQTLLGRFITRHFSFSIDVN
jgi:hypothetical protein